jgi:hypothetical protein
MPRRVGLGAALARVRCDHRSQMVHPAPNGLIGQPDPAFRQQIFDVTEAQGEPEIEADRLMNDLRRKPVAAVANSLHGLGYRATEGAASRKTP